MNKQELRLECLKIAVNLRQTQEDIVVNAGNFYDFIIAENIEVKTKLTDLDFVLLHTTRLNEIIKIEDYDKEKIKKLHSISIQLINQYKLEPLFDFSEKPNGSKRIIYKK